MSDEFERVCKELENRTGYRPRGGASRRKGKCPAHEDDKASLAIRDDLDNKLIGVTCHAGCTFDDIIGALRMTPKQLRIESSNGNGHKPSTERRPSGGKEATRYAYTDEAGNPLYYNVRFEPKDFRMADATGAIRSLPKDLVRVPYRLPELLQAIAEGRPVYWVEGEKDADALIELGHAATTTAGGANAQILDAWAGYFLGAHVIVVCDRDKPGREYGRTVARMLINSAATVELVQSATPQPKSDISDHLQAGYRLDQLESLPAQSIRRTRWTVADLLATKPKPLRWVLPGIIPEGLTLLVGAPKAGKSWFNLGLLVSLATGRPDEVFGWGQQVDPSTNLYLALEDPHRRVHTRLRQVVGDMPFPAATAGDVWLDVPPLTETGTEEIERWIEQHPSCRVLLVDVLAKVRGKQDTTSGLYQADYEAIGRLKTIADEYGIGVVVTHHDRKKSDEDFLNMVSGTKGVTGAADTILYLTRKRGTNSGVLQCESRDVEEASYQMELLPETGRWHIIDRIEPGSDRSHPSVSTLDQISQVILARGESSPEEIAKILDMDVQQITTVCERAAQSGSLQVDSTGKWFVPKKG